jgi:hypothetical protein
VVRLRDSCAFAQTSEEGPRAFFPPELKAKVIELYGVEPSVRFAEVSALIDNEVGVA